MLFLSIDPLYLREKILLKSLSTVLSTDSLSEENAEEGLSTEARPEDSSLGRRGMGTIIQLEGSGSTSWCLSMRTEPSGRHTVERSSSHVDFIVLRLVDSMVDRSKNENLQDVYVT